MSNFQHLEVLPLYDPEAGNILNQQIYMDWYNAAANLAAAKVRLGRIRQYQNQYIVLDQDIDNFRFSRSWLASQHREEEGYLLLNYIDLLEAYLFQRNFFTELCDWCEDGLQACQRLHSNPGALLFLKGKALNALGSWQEAMLCYQAAIEASAGTDQHIYADATLALGRLQFNQGDYSIALETLDHAEKLLLDLEDQEQVATVYSERAAYYLNRADPDRALSLYLKAEHIRQQSGGTSTSDLLMLGVVLRKKKDFEQATDYLQQLLALGETQHNPSTVATASHHLAWIAFDQGKLNEARLLCGKAKMLYEDIQDRRGMGDVYEQIGRIEMAEGHFAEAISPLMLSLSLRKEIHNQHGMASSLSILAIAHFKMWHLPTAVWDLCQSLAAYQRIGMLNQRRIAVILRKFLYHLWK
jgi:tetratricopeptide (TPR) repeat protein